MTSTEALPHIGRKIKKLRELKGMKQETLAQALGISHQAVSKIEQSASVDEDRLAEVAKALEVTPDAIKNFNEDATVNIIASNHNGTDQSAAVNFQCYFNPLEKIIQLYDEKVALLERLLKDKEKMLEWFNQQQASKK